MDTPALEYTTRLVRREDRDYEQVVMCEILIPDTPNCYGDIYTREAIKEFCYEFARQGYGIDVNHDQIDVTGHDAYVVESFLARAGDPDFIEGSWVVAMKIVSASLWQDILDGVINGYSFEATCFMTPVMIQNLANRQVVGVTEPDPVDGHTHDYLVILDPYNRPVSGATSLVNGHDHKIATHTVTEVGVAAGEREHTHRYQVIVKENEDADQQE
jgi:hypothetical protein